MQKGSQSLGFANLEMLDPPSAENMDKWDRREKEIQESRQRKEARKGQKETSSNLVKDLFKKNEDAFSGVGQATKPTWKTQEVKNPLKSKPKPKENKIRNLLEKGVEKEKKAQGKERWKQVASEKGKAQESIILAQTPLVGTKREKLEESKDLNERPHKRVCAMLSYNGDQFGELSTVAATQHHRKQWGL